VTRRTLEAKQSNQKLTMALPINFPDLVYTDHLSLQVALFTIVSLLLSFFILPQDSESEGEEQDLRLTGDIQTPQKRPRALPTPSAPKKKQRTITPSPVLKPKALFTEEENKPAAQIKPTKVVLPKIKDVRTLPSIEHKLSFGTQVNSKLTLSILKSQQQAKDLLNAEATLYDFTGPVSERRPLALTNSCIELHIQSLINIKCALTYLNQTQCALPHNGTGTLTSFRDGSRYLLTDKAFNAICHVTQVNYNLSKALNKVYDENKAKWSQIPKAFENACALAREAHILAMHISRLHSANANMTSWSDW